ncbi:MAG: class I SAM-dependent methyltransferase [Thermodesulfobacteriota bacterium]
MTEFKETRWSERDYSGRYIDAADIIVIERRRMIEIVKSFYRHNVLKKRQKTILDLGCGDGILTHELLQLDGTLSATLIDGSDGMLERARERLKDYRNVSFIKASFQELLSGEPELPSAISLAVSSLAIHHLPLEEKRELFMIIHSHLESGGAFLNIDTTLSPTEDLEEWYIELWREWIDERRKSLKAEGNYDEFISKYREEAHYRNLDTLHDQLTSLRENGFRDVDCFYKYGMVALYGGKR